MKSRIGNFVEIMKVSDLDEKSFCRKMKEKRENLRDSQAKKKKKRKKGK